jgi:putative transposase
VDPRDSGICGAPYGASPCGDTFTLFYLNIQRFKSFHPTLKDEACPVVKVLDKVYILETGIKKITIGYARYREAVQSVKGNGYASRAIHGRERKRKRDIRLKIANIIVNTAKNLNAIVVLEKLPKQCPRNMIRDVRDSALRHRIYQAGFRGS